MNHNQDSFSVDIIYALPDRAKVISVMVDSHTQVADAVLQSGMIDFFPEIDIDTVKLGSFSRLIKASDRLEPGMRVEIYRPLIADPKDVRRRRAEQAKEDGRLNKVTGAKL
ncbi:RnfH family protein [Shewanella sp. NIFS-20-20]|uniref:RnfH family protein n=1 Tax=Shewanella sp. NIFS-20-20 TaxID=2853806 RepID=UPI001C454038|nr:RnfH family protein [Shewanella sp. NIFS-20-20]MBV7315376.1 RnfH family protein [Shewanella sp. NIFS-20-20]